MLLRVGGRRGERVGFGENHSQEGKLKFVGFEVCGAEVPEAGAARLLRE